MPYINKTERIKFALVDEFNPKTAGELNYIFTKLALNYIKQHGERYQNYNDIVGALEGAKLELYRKQIASYEDIKCADNGDIE